jgi:hypothetical protein
MRLQTVRAQTFVITGSLLLAGAASASAQVASVGSAVPQEQMQARFQIAAMEGVLERAVQLGARRLSQQVQAVSPDALFIAGAARAKGFWLEGYGVFFDVDVPAMRRSVAWSFRALDRPDRANEAAIQTLRRNLPGVHDPQARREMEEAIQRLSRTIGPPMMPPPGAAAQGPPGVSVVQAGAATTVAAPASAPTPVTADAAATAVLDDPGQAYTDEVKSALIEAMITYGAIPIADDQWLTIAARDNEDSRLGGDPYDVSTIILRIRGDELAAYRAGRITKQDVVKRVEVREY